MIQEWSPPFHRLAIRRASPFAATAFTFPVPLPFGQPLGSAYVYAYDIKTGAMEATYPITITNPFAGMSAASCAAFGPDGKLYVVEPFVGIIRMDLTPDNTQSVYATFPPAPPGTSLLNDLAFDNAGNLYVTDSFAATIYRVPAGGGAAAVWFTDPRLAGDPGLPFGVNGIRMDENYQNVYVSVTAENGTFDGVIYRLPLASPTAANLFEFHRYPFLASVPARPRWDRLRQIGKAVRHPGRHKPDLRASN